MRLLIAHEAPAGAGGVESYLAAMMPALRARGHQLAFLCAEPRAAPGPTRLDDSPDVFSVADQGLDAALEGVRRWGPDVCFSHNMGPLAIDEGLLVVAPTVKMMHGYFGTCVSGLKSHAFPVMQPCARTFGLACLGLYLPRRCGQLRPGLMFEQFAWSKRQQRLFNRYAQVVVASTHMAREYERHGVATARLTTAPLFTTTPWTGPARPLPATPTVLFLGRMTPLKGGDLLIHAVAHAMRTTGAPIEVSFGGSGPAEPAWRQLAGRLGVAAAFHGWVSGDARVRLLRSASVLAVPSVWPEPFGLVGLEAAAHGVPAVAFEAGGIGEWLHDGVNGRMVREVGRAEALGGTLARLLSAPEELARLGSGARGVAAEMTITAHLGIVETVLHQAAAPARTVA